MPKSASATRLVECLQGAEVVATPQQSYKALYSLAKQVQQDERAGRRYSKAEGEHVVNAAHRLAARLLRGQASIPGGSSRSNHASSSRTVAWPPILRFDSKQLSMTVWSLSKLVGVSSRVRGRPVIELVDAIATHVAKTSVLNHPAEEACKNWSILLYGMAKMGFSCKDSRAVQQLFESGAKELPQIVHSQQHCVPQDASNSMWAFATAQYGGSVQQLVAEVASNLERVMEGASPQAWSNAVWALATLHSQNVGLGQGSAVVKVVSAGVKCMVQQRWRATLQGLSNTLWALATLGHHPGTATINTLVTAMAERSNTAAPQELSNTLWALATLGHHPGTATINTLVTAMAERSNTAAPQELSNTLWALATLGHHPGTATINTLATAVAERRSTAKPQDLSNTLQALGSLRWYQPAVHGELVKGLLFSIGSSTQDATGQHFSNALFSCALSYHFDSNVDALAAWGSQQGLQQWTEQDLSNMLFAWAILAATAHGDTASMRALAQHLFKESSWRGSARFTVVNDMGKLYSAHLEAQHGGLPGGGLTDSKLLQLAKQATVEQQQGISQQLSHVADAVAVALHGHFEVQAAMVQGYHTLIVLHPSCPCGLAIAVTQRNRDFLYHPAGQLYGKTALRLKHIERGCDGLVQCDESELQGCSIEEQQVMLLQRIKQATKG